MRRRYKRKLFKKLPMGKIVPNLVTLAALFVGLTQVLFAVNKQWEYVIVSVLVAAFLDATDGRLARLFGSCSRFGAELDSLSDFAVFGLCPAIVMYFYSLEKLDRVGWIVAVFFAICMCLRLARFNTHDIERVKSHLAEQFFIGVPAPAGAVLALFPIILHNAFNLELFENEYLSVAMMVSSGALCISRIPTLSIKKLHVNREQYIPFLVCIVVLAGISFAYTWKALCCIILAYIISMFFTVKRAKLLLSNCSDQVPADQQF